MIVRDLFMSVDTIKVIWEEDKYALGIKEKSTSVEHVVLTK